MADSSEQEQQKTTNTFSFPFFQNYFASKTRDVQFIFGNEDESVQIPAHKGLLAASSPVFDAMFNGELKEEGDLKIVDCSSKTFKTFLKLFYGDQLDLTTDNITEIFKLADKYDVSQWFKIGEQYLKSNLTAENMLL